MGLQGTLAVVRSYHLHCDLHRPARIGNGIAAVAEASAAVAASGGNATSFTKDALAIWLGCLPLVATLRGTMPVSYLDLLAVGVLAAGLLHDMRVVAGSAAGGFGLGGQGGGGGVRCLRPGYVGVYRASTLCLNTGFAMQAWSSQYYGCYS